MSYIDHKFWVLKPILWFAFFSLKLSYYERVDLEKIFYNLPKNSASFSRGGHKVKCYCLASACIAICTFEWSKANAPQFVIQFLKLQSLLFVAPTGSRYSFTKFNLSLPPTCEFWPCWPSMFTKINVNKLINTLETIQQRFINITACWWSGCSSLTPRLRISFFFQVQLQRFHAYIQSFWISCFLCHYDTLLWYGFDWAFPS